MHIQGPRTMHGAQVDQPRFLLSVVRHARVHARGGAVVNHQVAHLLQRRRTAMVLAQDNRDGTAPFTV